MTRKILTMLFVASAAALNIFAAVSITTSAKTVQKAGGAYSVTISGSGSWTATSDSSWLTILQGSSGTGAGSCVYSVDANMTADTRIGHLTIGGNLFTVTQYGYEATITPTSVNFSKAGGDGTINVTVDAGITWSATANDSWISVSPSSGMSVGAVTYTVASYAGVVSRVGSITIGGKTFTITQTGVDVSISPEKATKESGSGILSVNVNALATTKWDVVPNASWISVIDKESGYGDYTLMLAVNSNPSFVRRTGTVTIGSATLTIEQDGLSSASLSITPETATASASGAYGNVAVYATPDASWTAESTASWLTISEGASGAGNGNIKYVASANPTLSSRTGQIVVTPPHKVIEPDLYRGLVCWILEKENIEGGESRCFSYSMTKEYDGSFYNAISGANLTANGEVGFTLAISFMLGEVNRINRLLTIGGWCFGINEDNLLSYSTSTKNGVYEVLNNDKFEAKKLNANQWYTFLIKQDFVGSGGTKFYLGNKDEELQLIGRNWFSSMFSVLTNNIKALRLGYCLYPSPGFLTDGYIANLRIWTRALTDGECKMVDMFQHTDMSADDVPAGVSSDVSWLFMPLDQNAFSTSSKSMKGVIGNATLTGWNGAVDRFGVLNTCLISSGAGRVTIKNFESLFEGDYVLNNGKSLDRTTGSYDWRSGNYYMPYAATSTASSQVDATYSVWVWANASGLPESDSISIFARTVTSTDYKGKSVEPQNSNSSFDLQLNKDGKIVISGSGVTTTTFNPSIANGAWHMLTVVGRAGSSIEFYIDGKEVGNIASTMTLGYLPPIDRRYYDYSTYPGGVKGSVESCATFVLGGFNGAVDGLQFFGAALTSAEVNKLYDKQKEQKVIHTVTQGVQNAKLNKVKDSAVAEGCTSTVSLTLAQSVQWTAESNNDWITITSDEEGAGSAVIAYTVAANPAVTSRTGSITIAGIKMTIVQAGLVASVNCDDTSFGVESDSGNIWVATEGGGTWTASSDSSWLHVLTSSGTGSGPVTFVVDDYSTTTESRVGTITVAGKKVVVTQQGYELSIDPKVAEIGSNAGAGQFGVAAPIDAVWEAIADCDWITIVGSRTGIGDGIIQYSVADNTTGQTRVGRIVISGKTYTITQKTTLPVIAATIGSGTVAGTGNFNQGSVVTLKATAAAGYVFSHWSGDAVGVTNEVSITVDTSKNVTANFIPESAAEQLAASKAAQGGFYTRDQIHNLEVGNLVLDVDSSTGKARIGVQLQETSDLNNPNWQPVEVSSGDIDLGSDGTVGIKASATGNAKFFRVVTPSK